MPLEAKKLSPNRASFSGKLSASEIASLVSDTDLRILQAMSEVDAATWELLNNELFAKRPDIQLRIFGFYSSVCDLSFLSKMSNVRRFSADCLMKATGIEHVASMQKLESLSIGIYSLENFDFLADLPTNQIKELCLGNTKSKKPRLELLQRFKNLKKLCLAGQQKEIEAISSLALLEELILCSISPADLDFIRPLPLLWSLDIKLGGIKDLSALDGMNQIKHLKLLQVRGLSDLSPISNMLGLEFFILESLRNVTAIPNLSKLPHLQRVYLENMKGLTNVASVASAPALKDFIHASAKGMDPKDYEAIVKMKSIKKVAVWFGSDKKNTEFRQLAVSYGVAECDSRDFLSRYS